MLGRWVHFPNVHVFLNYISIVCVWVMRRSRPVLCCSCCLCMCLCIWLFLCLCSCMFRVVWCGFGWWGSQDRWNNGDRPGIWKMHISVTVTMIVVTVKIVIVMTMMTWMVKLMTAPMITRVKITLMITRTIEEAKTGGRMVAWWPGIRGGPHVCASPNSTHSCGSKLPNSTQSWLSARLN